MSMQLEIQQGLRPSLYEYNSSEKKASGVVRD